jgi:hypothetical protein
MITTNGNDVKLWGPGQFTELLGSIDTPIEAWLMISTHRDLGIHMCGPYVYQSGPEGTATNVYRPIPGGFEIREQHGTKGCHPFEIVETMHFVGQDGSTRVLDEHVAFSDPDRCVVD